MTIYECDKCKKEFNNKTKFDDHMKRKTPCKPLTGKKLKNKKNFIYPCEICDTVFERSDHLQRHCKCASHLEKEKLFIEQNDNSINKINKSDDNSINKTNKSYNKITKTKSIDKSHNKNIDNSDKSHNKITNNIINPTFFLYPFGQEDISVLSKDDKISILDSKNSPLTGIIKKTNLNPDLPQFHNIGYTDKKNPDGFIYNGSLNLYRKCMICVAYH